MLPSENSQDYTTPFSPSGFKVYQMSQEESNL